MPADGTGLGDIIADSGYSHRDAAAWAIPLRRAGAALVQDTHLHDRGPRGTYHGAIICNGNLYCAQTPRTLLELSPLPPGASNDDITIHNAQAAELARHILGQHTADNTDGYHRAACPATTGKLRCPLRPASMKLERSRPEILAPPEHPSACCTQQTITAGPDIAAKTRQKHDYLSPAWRRSSFTAHRSRTRLRHHQRPRHHQHRPRLVPPDGPDPAHPVDRLPARVRNQRILTAWNNHQTDNARRAAAGLPPRTRKKRRADPATA